MIDKSNEIHPSALLGANVEIGHGVKIGPGAVIHDNVSLADGVVVGAHCSIGENLAASRSDPHYNNPRLSIGEFSNIRSGSVVYAGSSIGKRFNTGHNAVIREGMHIGDFCSVGTAADLLGKSRMGNYVRLHSGVFLAQNSNLGDYSLFFPRVVTTDDPTPPSLNCIGVTVYPFACISAAAVLLPSVQVKEHAVVGAGAVVTKDIPAYSLAVGNPARVIRDVREVRSRTEADKSHYPWIQSFSRGMPWDHGGLTEWCSQLGMSPDDWSARVVDEFVQKWVRNN